LPAAGPAGILDKKERSGMKNPPPSRQKPRPKPVDPAYLERAALYYLERFSASAGHLASILRRKIARRGLPDGVEMEEVEGWIGALLEKLTRLGYLDDEAYARMRAQSLIARGRPLRAVRQGLAQKALDPEIIDGALAAYREGMADPDLAAAIRYLRRRRLGPARLEEATRRPSYQKDMAALARAGFSYDIARRLLDLPDGAALDALEEEL
jgi:regulatory protein